jgi:hypothetical protein
MIPEIDIWRAAQLMLKRYGDKALEESAARADELAAAGDDDGVATWRRITHAVGELANKPKSGSCLQAGRQFAYQFATIAGGVNLAGGVLAGLVAGRANIFATPR